MRLSLSSVCFALCTSLAAGSAFAQSTGSLPATTDCTFAENNACIERYRSALRARERAESDEAYTRGWRAFAGITIAVGAPQFVGGIYAATQAPPHTNLVGYSVGWTINGVFQTMTGTVFAVVPFRRPYSAPGGGSEWIPSIVFGLASIGHASWAAAAWAAPPQDVHPTVNHLFAASLVVDAAWYASLAIVSRVDFRDQRARAALSRVAPYASLDGRSSSFGVAGRF